MAHQDEDVYSDVSYTVIAKAVQRSVMMKTVYIHAVQHGTQQPHELLSTRNVANMTENQILI